MCAAFDEARDLVCSESDLPKEKQRLDRTDHMFKNRFDWRGWAESRHFAKELVGELGMQKFEIFVHPSAKLSRQRL